MKKKVALALSVGVLLTTVSPIQAVVKADSIAIVNNSKIEKLEVEKYIPRIKSILQIGDEYDNFNVHKFERENTIDLSWYGNSKGLSVTIDEAGNIVGYNKYEHYENGEESVYKFPKITRVEGEKIAREFIKKVSPDLIDKIEIDNDMYGVYSRYDLDGYSYNFTRAENNIPFHENSVHVQVNSQNGEVRSFYLNGKKDLKLPSKEGIISEHEAKELYKENIGLELMYKLRGIDNEFEPYLGYNIIDIDKTVDAKTKDIISTSYKYYYPLYGQSLYSNNIENVSSDDEVKLINSKSIITRKDASEKIINTFKLGEGYEVSGSKLKKLKEKEEYVWEVMVMYNTENSGSGTNATIDAKTGQILSFNDPGSWREDENGEAKYKKEELLKKAKDFIQKSNAEKYKEVEYAESNEIDLEGRNKIYEFEFIRKVNDIKVENSGFRVGLSAITGNIVGYSYNWDDSELPSSENIIDKEKAKEILLDGRDLELQYHSLNQDEKDIKLVYDFKDKHIVIDANKGEIIDSQQEMKEKYSKNKYKDIENSFVKDKINKLQQSIVLFEGENFKPKEEVTQKDFLGLLSQTKHSFYFADDEDYLYERLIDENIIKKEEKNVEAKITREEAMKYIVRAFGQEQSGVSGNIYKINYNDAEQISDNLKGHVAIASGLGVISGEGNFRPKDNLTREEAISLIYNILNRDN